MTALLETAFARLLRRDRRAESGPVERRALPRNRDDRTALLEWSDASERGQAELVHLHDRTGRGIGSNLQTGAGQESENDGNRDAAIHCTAV